MERKIVIITADGACLGNGQTKTRAAAAAILNYLGHRRAIAEYIGESTNQRAEIVAVALGLESLKEPCTVIVRSDSQYVVETMKGTFKRRTNHEYWARLDNAAETHDVTFEWVRGHNGDTEQEAADTIARSTAEIGDVNQLILTEVIQRLENVITPALRNAVSEGLHYLANDCDGARTRDGVGFSKFDADFGHRLASKSFLNPREFAAGRKLLRRYAGQLAGYNPTIAAIL
jgi:ribonuclease HI